MFSRFTSLVMLVAVVLASFGGRSVDARDDETVRVVFVGDIMLDCLPGKVIERGDDPFQAFAALLSDADFTVGNLECVVATRGAAVKKPYTFRAHPRCVPLLVKHFDAVSLANNHTGDFGD